MSAGSTRTMIAFIVVFSLLVAPCAALFWLWRGSPRRRQDWLCRLFFVGSFSGVRVFAGAWDWLGIFWPLLLLPAFFPIALASWRQVRVREVFWLSEVPWGSWLLNAVLIVSSILFGVGIVRSVAARFAPSEARDLLFPLRDGVYAVRQGGSNGALNGHAVSGAQRYALDITRLNRFGTRARGIYPAALSAYGIFDQPIHAPCSGRVVEALDGLPDLDPGTMDPEHPPGDHVMIDCAGLRVILAHLKRGTLQVQRGDSVQAGRRLGNVGNSGNTSEPHLHVHAEDAEGVGVAITFGGRFLVRNSLYLARN